ncbi:hypothetical protein Q3G72_034794 [Acer saccharum]|nr:hypothetical protein Q3G72_034794 [Acer saccharum]
MNCVSSISYSFILNGKVRGHISPTRGLRQGDPLSPYLFMICAEGLSNLIPESERRGNFAGFRCSRMGPKVSHLFFTDDSLLFSRATKDKCINIKNLLKKYADASGQSVNFQKSAVCFSKQISTANRTVLAGILEMSVVEQHTKYLGLPCVTSRRKWILFDNIKERVWNKLQSWSNRFFSGGGREVLLKAVIQSIPVYSMNLFRIPASLISDIHYLCARFWWGGGGKKRKLHWCLWETLCKDRYEWGIGFRELGAFNQSLLAKQCWRIIQLLNSLVNRILKGCYFQDSSFLNAKCGKSGSFLWNSLMWGREIIEKGSRWRIGGGQTVRI